MAIPWEIELVQNPVETIPSEIGSTNTIDTYWEMVCYLCK